MAVEEAARSARHEELLREAQAAQAAEAAAAAAEGMAAEGMGAKGMGAKGMGGERPWFAAEDDKPWYVQQR